MNENIDVKPPKKIHLSKRAKTNVKVFFCKFLFVEIFWIILFFTLSFFAGRIATENNTYKIQLSPNEYKVSVSPSRYGDNYYFITPENIYRAYWHPPVSQISSNEYFYPGSSQKVIEGFHSEPTLTFTILKFGKGFNFIHGVYSTIVDIRGEDVVYYSIDGYNKDVHNVKVIIQIILFVVEILIIAAFLFILWFKYNLTIFKRH